MLWTMHTFASSDVGSVIGTLSVDGTVTAIIVTCAAISAAKSVTRKESRALLRPYNANAEIGSSFSYSSSPMRMLTSDDEHCLDTYP